MKRSINLIELISASVLVFGSVLIFWKNTDVRLTALEIRVEKQEQNSEKIMQKLDILQQGINDVKVALQNKEDRN
jgi:uncharacterized membrane protein